MTELGRALRRSFPVHARDVDREQRDRIFIRIAVLVAALIYVALVAYGVGAAA